MPRKTLGQTVQSRLKWTRDEMLGLSRAALHEVNRASGRRISIGVTGLSRSGKTAFITSLIHQLNTVDSARLGGFSLAVSGRILGLKIQPLDDLPLFPYLQGLDQLSSSPPQWPESTRQVSGCLLELRLRSRRQWRKNSKNSRGRSLFIEIRDYPGEWLLDLPLLGQDYADWCAQTAVMFKSPLRQSLAGETLWSQLNDLDPLQPFNLALHQQLKSSFDHYLQSCKSEGPGLSSIQPGRFLIPGQVEDPDWLEFVPLLQATRLSNEMLKSAPKDSFLACYQQRYRNYVSKLVKPFYRDIFYRVDRQVILADVLGALNGGPEYIRDMRDALAVISDSFSYGSRNPLLNWFHPKIDRLAFAATKTDQVIARDHDNVRHLLANLVSDAYKQAAFEGISPKIEAIASVRSSKEVDSEGEPGISGILDAGTPVGYVHPEIPDHIPDALEYGPFEQWKIPKLSPPLGFRAEDKLALPHIRMDSILEILLGDL